MAIVTLAFPSLLFSVNFNAPRAYSLGGGYFGFSVVQGDFNGDGAPDLAVAAINQTGAIEVFLGQADGSFRHLANYKLVVDTVVESANALITADFNNDGNLDLAITSGSGVSILLGRGDGTFAPPVPYAAGTGTDSVATGDFNGDGIPDLVTTNPNSDNVSILLGKGDGTFLLPVNYGVGGYPEYVAVGDFNGDGKPDLAVTNYNDLAEGTVSILFGVGNGAFEAPVNYPTGKHPQSIAVGDFNRDGKPDLAITQYEGAVAILLANGGGTFLPPVFLHAGPNPAGIVVEDVNQDGMLDLAVANQGDNNGVGGYTVSILMGNGDGTFQTPAVNYVDGAQAVVFGDFNGDGKVDLACGGFSFSILLNNGKGGFEQPVRQAAGTAPSAVAVGDFNGDGKPDLAVANWGSNNISILLGKGDGTFMPQVTYNAGDGNPNAVVVGDFNGDGKLDLAVANYSGVLVLLGNGDGTFQPPLFNAVSQADSLVAADFNGDGKLDLATTDYAAVVILYGNGDGTFTQSEIGDLSCFSVTVGDFNGDGKPDLAVPTPIDRLLRACVHPDHTRRGLLYLWSYGRRFDRSRCRGRLQWRW
jgi:hypothetical protein